MAVDEGDAVDRPSGTGTFYPFSLIKTKKGGVSKKIPDTKKWHVCACFGIFTANTDKPEIASTPSGIHSIPVTCSCLQLQTTGSQAKKSIGDFPS